MKKAVWIFPLTVIAMSLTSVPVSMAIPGESLPTAGPANPVPEFDLSGFLDIWIDDVDNVGPEVAYNNRHGEYLVVWDNYRGGGVTRDIYARRVSTKGILFSNFTIIHDANFWNYDPVVAYNSQADEYLVVYTYDSMHTSSDIYARRVEWNGGWMSDEIRLGRPDKSGKQINPAVVYNSMENEYLVVYENVWGNSADIDAQRVASDGTLLGWRNIAVGGGQFRRYPDVAYDSASNRYLIAYTITTTASALGNIYAKSASWNLDDLSSEIHICDDAHHAQDLGSLTASLGEFIAVWSDEIPGGAAQEIYARRLAPDGTPLGPDGGFWIAGRPNATEVAPDIAYSPGFGYLVTWFRLVGSPPTTDVFGRFIMPGRDHGSEAEFELDTDIADQTFPAVACATVGDCLVVEMDNNSPGGDYEIRGRMVFLDHVYLPLTLKGP